VYKRERRHHQEGFDEDEIEAAIAASLAEQDALNLKKISDTTDIHETMDQVD